MKAGIVGAGILGRLLALALHRSGWEVSLFDQGDEAGSASCSMAALGLLTPLAELEHANSIIYTLGNEALQQHWPTILNQLDGSILFQKNGTLILSQPNDQAESIRFVNLIADKAKENTVYKKLSLQEIQILEPDISKFNQGYYLSEEGSLDNQALMIALWSHLHSKIHWHIQTEVKDIQPHKIILNDRIETVDCVFDCRGMGAKSIFTDLRGIRGENIWLHAPHVFITHQIRFLHPRYSIYIVPRSDHVYLIGATEIESEDYSPISVQSVLELLTAAYSVHPGFSEARIIKTVTHCRPTLPNHLPKIKYEEGFIAINGLYRHGFLIAPTLIVDVLSYLQQGISAVRYPLFWEKPAKAHNMH